MEFIGPFTKRKKKKTIKDTISCEILTVTLFSIASFVIAQYVCLPLMFFFPELLHFYSYT